MVVLDGWTHVKPLFWAPLLPTAHIRIISFVHLAKTDGASRDQGVADLLLRTASKFSRRCFKAPTLHLLRVGCVRNSGLAVSTWRVQVHPRLIVT